MAVQLSLFDYRASGDGVLGMPVVCFFRMAPVSEGERRLCLLGMVKCPDGRVIWLRGRVCPVCGAPAVLRRRARPALCYYCLGEVDFEECREYQAVGGEWFRYVSL